MLKNTRNNINKYYNTLNTDRFSHRLPQSDRLRSITVHVQQDLIVIRKISRFSVIMWLLTVDGNP